MKFRTEIAIRPFSRQIGYHSRIFAVGSCFAANIASRLEGAGFSVTANPAGIMFNPESVADAIERCCERRMVGAGELQCDGGRWFHYGFHGSFAGSDPEEVAARINGATQEGHRALATADTVILTFGTAHVFRLADGGATVANCHKQPAAMFRRERLTVGSIVERYAGLFGTALRGKHVIVTVSPVRHLADGLDGNALSKSVLRVAAGELAERYGADYFPSYEILCDDLRDYRFYDADMVHPSSQAVDYVWEKFCAAAVSAADRELIPRAEAIARAAAHRPLHPDDGAYADFCRRQIEAIDSLTGPDLSRAREIFSAGLQINS